MCEDLDETPVLEHRIRNLLPRSLTVVAAYTFSHRRGSGSDQGAG